MLRRIVLTAVLAVVPAPSTAQAPGGITVSVFPERPFLERGDGVQYLNFDFVIDNPTAVTRNLDRIEVSVLDRRGGLVVRKYVAHHGVEPGIKTIPNRTVKPKGKLGIFNPFFWLEGWIETAKLRYEFTFEVPDSPKRDTVTVEVTPVPYSGATRLTLPVRGRAIVYDGHDFYSHHRRVDPGHPMIRELGLTDNPVRYANDICMVDDRNQLHRGDPDKIEEWLSYGAPVVAPAAGLVVAATGAVPENRIERRELRYPADMPTDFEARASGNHVVIDHGNGEFSHLAHLRHGSVSVKPGDRVEQGQQVGEIGFSGDTGLHVHLHYSLWTAPTFTKARALPVYFSGFKRFQGSGAIEVERGRIDSGDLIESTR